MSAKREVIAELYRQVGAPDWASPNLDGLTDVLRDLSWLPEKPVLLTLPDLSGLSGPEREMLLHVLARAATESIGSPRPVRVRSGDG
jgi:hypothetical protein